MKQRCRYCQTSFDPNLDKCPNCGEETYKGSPIGTLTEEAYHRTYNRGSYYKSEREKKKNNRQ